MVASALSSSDIVTGIHTVEEGIEIVVVDFAEFEKIFGCFWASVYFEVNDNVAQQRLE
jgi:hypothetical protein